MRIVGDTETEFVITDYATSVIRPGASSGLCKSSVPRMCVCDANFNELLAFMYGTDYLLFSSRTL